MKLLLAIGIAAALSGCTTTQGAPSATGPAVNQKTALATAKAAILYQLKDPDSARWRTAKVAPNGNVCIEVNARNSFGGYTGFETYFYNFKTGDLFDNANLLASVWCRHPVTMPKGSVSVNVQ